MAVSYKQRQEEQVRTPLPSTFFQPVPPGPMWFHGEVEGAGSEAPSGKAVSGSSAGGWRGLKVQGLMYKDVPQ